MTISTVLEVLFSALLAPIMMVIQTGTVMHIAMGTDSGWNPQRRDDGSVPLIAIVRRHLPHMLLGALTLVAGLLIAPSLVAWMSPTIAGLLLAALLSWGSAQRSAGIALRRIGLLQTPEERVRPAVVRRARYWRNELHRTSKSVQCGLGYLHGDQAMRELHMRFLPTPVERSPGDVDVEKAIAGAKLDEAQSIDDAVSWLKSSERAAVLLDRKLMGRLAGLPPTERDIQPRS
jgi:membrane glycosyltransferase